MRVFVAGGTGVVGRRLVARLAERGHEVVATTRSAARTGELRALGADGVVVDGLDAAAVQECVARAEPEVVVHQMTALAGGIDFRRFDRTFATTNALRTQGTRFLLDAAQAAGTRRFVAQSYTGWMNARTGGPVKTEDDPLDPDPAPAQREVLAAIRTLEEQVTGARLEGLVLRYGGPYGPGASDELVGLVRRRRLPVVGDGAGVWSWLHADDAAAATVAAVEGGACGVLQVVDDDPAPVSAWLPYLAEAVGARPPRHVPVWVGRLLGGEVVVRMMTEARGASNARAKRELGWQPSFSSWRQGFREGLGDQARPAA